MAGFRQTIHSSRCPNFPGHLYPSLDESLVDLAHLRQLLAARHSAGFPLKTTEKSFLPFGGVDDLQFQPFPLILKLQLHVATVVYKKILLKMMVIMPTVQGQRCLHEFLHKSRGTNGSTSRFLIERDRASRRARERVSTRAKVLCASASLEEQQQ